MESNANHDEPDVVLKILDTKFSCHRVLLARNSPYFEAMFTHNFAERNKEEIEIKDLEPETMEMLLRSIHLGKDVLEGLQCDQVLALLQASSMLQFESLQKHCIEAVTHRWLGPETALQIMAQADALNLTHLYFKARVMALWNFSTIKNNSQFLKLSIDELEDYLQDNGLNTTGGELEVFEACFSWIQSVDASEKEKSMWRALQCVRFSDISISNMKTILLCISQLKDEAVLELFEYILKKFEVDASSSSSIQLLNEDLQSQTLATDKKLTVKTVEFHSNPEQDTDIESSSELRSTNKKVKVTISTNGNEKSSSASKRACSPAESGSEPLSKTCTPNESTISTEVKNEIAEKASLLMSSPPRLLPLVPCVVGRCFQPPRPYLIGFKENRFVPLVRLQKAEQKGSVEPNGYRVVIKGQDIFILGGEFLWGHSNWNTSVWRYDQLSESWTFETSMEHQCRHQSVCCLDDDIYVMGGFGKFRVIADRVNRYNTISKSWTHCPPLPSPIYSAACCAFKGCVYVFGPQVWSYNAQRHNWITITSCDSLTFNSALPHGDCIFLAGTYSKDLYKFDCKTLDFKCVGSFQLNAVNMCLVHDVIYMFGVDVNLRHQVETYDIKTNSFQVLDDDEGGEENTVCWSASYSVGSFAIVDY